VSKLIVKVLFATVLFSSVSMFAIDGTVLINQSTVMAAGGFPFKITQPGSYKLSGNLIVPALLGGIDISVPNVTLDLNGFSVIGPILCDGHGSNCQGIAGSATGIHASPGATIRNGHVQGFITGIVNNGGVVEDIHASNNFDSIVATNALVRRNFITNNSAGLICTSCTVLDNHSSFSVDFAFNLFGGGVFGSNTAVGHISLAPNVVSQGNNACTDGVNGGPC
jgi:hypothetical protein